MQATTRRQSQKIHSIFSKSIIYIIIRMCETVIGYFILEMKDAYTKWHNFSSHLSTRNTCWSQHDDDHVFNTGRHTHGTDRANGTAHTYTAGIHAGHSTMMIVYLIQDDIHMVQIEQMAQLTLIQQEYMLVTAR